MRLSSGIKLARSLDRQKEIAEVLRKSGIKLTEDENPAARKCGYRVEYIAEQLLKNIDKLEQTLLRM